MEELLANQGLCHIVEYISRFLDPKSIAQCREVCYSWKNLIDNDRRWVIFQLEHILKQEKIFINDQAECKYIAIKARFPKWNSFSRRVSKRQGTPLLKEFVKHMWIYFNCKPMGYYSNPLHDAVLKSNIEFVQLLIEVGMDLKKKNAMGWTPPNPLHFACTSSKIEMVQLLMQHSPNFDVNSRTKKGATIFHVAANNSDPQVPKLILNTFRFEDIRDHVGWTMLHWAVKGGAKETIEFLIESRRNLGINVEERTNQGSTILHLGCHHRDIEIVELVHNALQEINSDIDFNTRNVRLATPMQLACKNKTSDVAIHLLQRFPDKINVLGENGMHVFHYACKYGHLELLKHIFDNHDFDIDFNVTDGQGQTGLHHASMGGHFEVVYFLLENSIEKGMNIFQKDNQERTAENWAIQNGHSAILELLQLRSLRHRIPEVAMIRATKDFEKQCNDLEKINLGNVETLEDQDSCNVCRSVSCMN